IGRVNQAKAGGPIAFTSQHNDPVARTFAMNADGTGIHQITFHNPSTSAVADDYGPAVSPDGRQVAIIYGEDGGGQCGTFSPIVRSLYLVNIDGTNFHRVFPQSLRTYNDPQNGFALRCVDPDVEEVVWSPDGSHLLMRGGGAYLGVAQEGNCQTDSPGLTTSILNFDGS